MFKKLKSLQKYDKPVESNYYFKKEYIIGERDYFVGITNPNLRKLAKEYYKIISNNDLIVLMTNKIHEYRLLALFILEQRMLKAKTIEEQEKIIELYLKYIKFVNNWDLVDSSAYQLLGRYLYNINNYDLLYEFSKSDNLWIKRVSIVATNYLIRNDVLDITLDIVDNLLADKHDLIHKASGWMLRNLGIKNRDMLSEYIYTNYNEMSRTTLRYAIEHYQEDIRKRILKGDFSWK